MVSPLTPKGLEDRFSDCRWSHSCFPHARVPVGAKLVNRTSQLVHRRGTEALTVEAWYSPPSRILIMHSSSLVVPNSFCRELWLAVSRTPWAPWLHPDVNDLTWVVREVETLTSESRRSSNHSEHRSGECCGLSSTSEESRCHPRRQQSRLSYPCRRS